MKLSTLKCIHQAEVCTHCPVSNNGLIQYGSGRSRFYQLSGLGVLCCVLFIRNGEIDGRSPSFFVKQIIHDLVASCIVIHVDMNSVSYVSPQRRSLWLSALEIFHNNSCLLELRG